MIYELYERIKTLRQQASLSQVELAKKLGIKNIQLPFSKFIFKIGCKGTAFFRHMQVFTQIFLSVQV